MFSARLLRTVEPRAVALLLALALALAPPLVGLWPALGKGRMLWVGEPPAEQVERERLAAQQAQHYGAGSHEGHGANHEAAHSSGEAPIAHAGHDGADESSAHHDGHCALCVLAAVGWAPPSGLVFAIADRAVVGQLGFVLASEPRASLLWARAQARAPPVS